MKIMYKSIVLCSLLLFCLAAGAQKRKVPSAERFNIVLFIADDLDAGDIGPYGNKIVRTPNLDKFSKEAMLFTRAFASSPTCSPSRSTIFTGLMPLRHGGHGNHNGVKDGTPSIVQYLQPLGYKVALAGKLHIGPESVFPFERIAQTNTPEPGFEKKPGLNWDLNLDPVDQWLSKQKKSQPFMLVVADHSPHVIWPEKADYDPAQIDIPAKHIDTKETRASRARYYTDITKMDHNVGKVLTSLDKNGFAKNTIVLFVSDQGPQWPFAKWSLYDDGVQSPLMIRWPGTVTPDTKTGALVSLADLVPTLVESVGGNAPGAIDGQSFLPVLKGQKDTHREAVYATHTGDRLMNRAPARMVRTARYKYILNLAPEILYTTHMDKAKDHDGGREYWDSWRAQSFTDPHAAAVLWRYHNRPAEELYDVEADPGEMHNLAADPKYASVLEELRTKMKLWRKGQSDTITGPEEFNEQEEEKKKGQKPVAPYIF